MSELPETSPQFDRDQAFQLFLFKLLFVVVTERFPPSQLAASAMYDRRLGKGCPVNGLPTELLAHIFYLGTRDHDAPLFFPVLASHVCRLWRRVAVGSPELWTAITFSYYPLYKRSQVWIERSKSLPIEVKFEVTRLDSDKDTANEILTQLSHVSTILDIIVPHVTRWRKLEVAVDLGVFMGIVLARLAECAGAPLLETLALRHFNPYSLPASFVPFHGNAPRLSYVTLEDVSICWSSPLLHDLVKFELVSQKKDMWPSWVDFSRILRESPRLTDLELFHSGPAKPFTDWQDEPIELPSLKNFSLINDDPIYVSSLFRLLSMPNLKKLSLNLCEGDFSEFLRQLPMPPQSVLSGLQYLKLRCVRTGDSRTINAICEQLTNLKSIYLSCGFIHEFFTTLTESCSGTLYCPNLTMIITSGIPGQKIRSFITVRAIAGIPIKRIAMNKDNPLNEEDEKWLRENVQSFERFDDMDVDVEY